MGAERGTGYIVGPIYDSVFFLYAPLIALALGSVISNTSYANEPTDLFGRPVYPSSIFIATFIAAHLVLVLVRSHGNAEVFKRYPWRFTLVPALLFVGCYVSFSLSIYVSVLAIWWDVYHSSMQTFGLGRIYDMRAGNDPEAGRRLDQGLNHVLYIGPILGGAALMNHVTFFKWFEKIQPADVVSAFFASAPARIESWSGVLTWTVVPLGTVFVLYYVYAYWRLAQGGYRVSYQKVFLLAATALCSIYTWGFNSFGEAFFIMNFFHAWQYFAIVWATEGGNLQRVLRLDGRRWGKALVLALFVALPLGYGALVTVIPMKTNGVLFCTALVVSIMHFWYDGFIWSVRKKQIS